MVLHATDSLSKTYMAGRSLKLQRENIETNGGHRWGNFLLIGNEFIPKLINKSMRFTRNLLVKLRCSSEQHL